MGSRIVGILGFFLGFVLAAALEFGLGYLLFKLNMRPDGLLWLTFPIMGGCAGYSFLPEYYERLILRESSRISSTQIAISVPSTTESLTSTFVSSPTIIEPQPIRSSLPSQKNKSSLGSEQHSSLTKPFDDYRNPAYFHLGQRVVHKNFGFGNVGSINGWKVMVYFDDGSEKVVMDTYLREDA